MTPTEIIPTYQRVARAFATKRAKSEFFEKTWLDRMLHIASGKRVLDLGCGPGLPLSSYLAGRQCAVTGVDGAEAMIELFRENLPNAEAVHADMRGLSLERRFDAILAWDSFFHLAPEDQRGMFPVFAAHAAPGAALMFTSGFSAGEVTGHVEGQPVYHSSLCPLEYEKSLNAHGFEVRYFRPEDPDCGGHTIWLARFIGMPS